jgi:hypothetical protein
MILHADLALARRLEEAESAISAEAAASLSSIQCYVQEVAGGRAVFAGVGGVLTEAKALGLHGPVSEDELDRMEAVFFARGAAAKVVVCPLADASLLAGLAKRGYRLIDFESILLRSLADLGDLPEPAADVSVRPINPDESELYADVVAPAFAHPEPVTPEFRDLCRSCERISGSTAFLADLGGRPAGGGTLLVRDGLAFLAGAGTLPDSRRRGVQTALSVARLSLARARGCDLAVQGAQPGSTSQRTAERLGFRVAYTKAVLVREPG